MPGPEEPQSPPLLDFVPELMYPEYMPLEDEMLPAEEQPLPAAASPTADSPGYVPESDLEEDPEANDDKDPEEDPTDYLADRDDDDKEEEEEEPSEDDADDEDEDEEEEEERAPSSGRLCPTCTSADRPEITLPPRKRLGIDLGLRCEVGKSSAAAAARPIGGRRADYGFVDIVDAEISRRRAEKVGYGIRDDWVDSRDATKEVALPTLEGVNTRVTELAAVQEQDTQDIYGVIENTQGRQTQIYQRVKILVDDSQYHYETARLLDQEALVSREAWGRSMEVSYMTR
ncbi:hypothetical protein Tco_0155698 [Tanacetum coccineum]